jgi:hypothetical protein
LVCRCDNLMSIDMDRGEVHLPLLKQRSHV